MAGEPTCSRCGRRDGVCRCDDENDAGVECPFCGCRPTNHELAHGDCAVCREASFDEDRAHEFGGDEGAPW